MKVLFSGVDFSSRSGPNSFARRLEFGLRDLGVEVVQTGDFDVELAFIQSNLRHDKPIVQRLDGVWFSPKDVIADRNKEIRSTFHRASSVIWQSEFDRIMTEKWFGQKPGRVIHNGIELNRVKKFPDTVMKIRQTYKQIFVCSANWHPQKRLQANINMWTHLSNLFLTPSCLIIMGANPDVRIANPHVFYTGSISHEECLAVYAGSDWMIHLAWLDHCPNVVLEALSQETPIICTDSGGTSEIVKDNGLIIPEPTKYDFSVADYDLPPELSISYLASQVKSLPNVKIDASHIDIRAIAADYRSVLMSCVK